ncbi:hypothetical protein TNCV_4202891 [Trichonephila clavipes]|uniref:Uncharacterized protein n=1 Tax=Trichonephila clavipes TaxID=2585209 RepID=A0A8X6S901_TRICX|nr:hypothetical protein TNCV_4202891 [Trichonephila clavipes]
MVVLVMKLLASQEFESWYDWRSEAVVVYWSRIEQLTSLGNETRSVPPSHIGMYLGLEVESPRPRLRELPDWWTERFNGMWLR